MKIFNNYVETRQFIDDDTIVMDFFITNHQNEMFDLSIEVNCVGYYTYNAFRHDMTPCNTCLSKATCHCNIQEMDNLASYIIKFKGLEYLLLDHPIYEKYFKEITEQLYAE